MNNEAIAKNQTYIETFTKTKPRYTEEENRLLFEAWWNPQKRRALAEQLGRKISALRSQFCRLLKEKGISNQEYYNIMQSKHGAFMGDAPRKRSREIKDVDRIILETFAKHQAQGNSRMTACEELQQLLGDSYSIAALKLRFYRLLKRMSYQDEDLLQLGLEVLQRNQDKTANVSEVISLFPENNRTSRLNETAETVEMDETLPSNIFPASNIATKTTKETEETDKNSFFYCLSAIPDTLSDLEQRITVIEEQQRHQLDLRGFVEHLLAVDRDLKREDKLMEEVQKLIAENDKLQQQMSQKQEKLRKRETELTEVYKMLDKMLGDFIHLENVSKLASLGDFMHRLEITVDQFGNVLKTVRG